MRQTFKVLRIIIPPWKIIIPLFLLKLVFNLKEKIFFNYTYPWTKNPLWLFISKIKHFYKNTPGFRDRIIERIVVRIYMHSKYIFYLIELNFIWLPKILRTLRPKKDTKSFVHIQQIQHFYDSIFDRADPQMKRKWINTHFQLHNVKK